MNTLSARDRREALAIANMRIQVATRATRLARLIKRVDDPAIVAAAQAEIALAMQQLQDMTDDPAIEPAGKAEPWAPTNADIERVLLRE